MPALPTLVPAPASMITGDRLYLSYVNSWPATILAAYTQCLGGFRTQRPLAKVILDTTFGVAGSNDVVVPFTTGAVDTDNMYSSLTPTQLTIQTPGWYRIILQQHWDVNGSGQRACKIMVNGTNPSINAIASDSRAPGIGGIGNMLCCEAFAHLSYGSTIYANAYQNSGSVQNLQAGYSGSFMSAEWICP